MLGLNKVYYIDCFIGMESIADETIDMIFADLPYGTTQNPWDCAIDLEQLWKQYNRIIKPNGAIALFSQSPFDKVLACSNLNNYRYEWIWEKNKATGHLNVNRAPLKAHENILIFYKKQPLYIPQKTIGHSPVHSYTKRKGDGTNYGKTKIVSGGGQTDRYPRDVLKYPAVINPIHPTQKPVPLCENIINTYTMQGQIILDNCTGSGSIPVACLNTGRNFIAMDNGICNKEGRNKGRTWADIANERIEIECGQVRVRDAN